jgi:hypothetical protein
VHGVSDSARFLIRKPFARGGFCFPANGTASAPRNSTRFAARYPAHGLPCERFELSLAASPRITRGRGGWLGLTPWTTCTSYPLPALLAHSVWGQKRRGQLVCFRSGAATGRLGQDQRMVLYLNGMVRHGSRRVLLASTQFEGDGCGLRQVSPQPVGSRC